MTPDDLVTRALDRLAALKVRQEAEERAAKERETLAERAAEMPLRPGHCAGPCGRLVWRTAVAQRDVRPKTHAGQTFLLWPEPSSLYAMTWTPTGHTVGIPYCQACAPEIGESGPDVVGRAAVIGWETAKDRYREWYSDEKGAFFRAWLADHLGYDEAMVEATMSTWSRDRT